MFVDGLYVNRQSKYIIQQIIYTLAQTTNGMDTSQPLQAISWLQFFAILITCFFGVISGYLVSLIAPEELRKGSRYFEWLSRILVVAIIIGFILNSKLGVFHIVLLVSICLIIICFWKDCTDYIYILSSIILAISSENTNLLIAESSMIFLLGMVNASRYMLNFEKDEKIDGKKINLFFRVIVRYILFLVVGLIFFMLI